MEKHTQKQIKKCWGKKAAKSRTRRKASSAPIKPELKNYRFLLRKALKNRKSPRILVLGSTPELRDLAISLGTTTIEAKSGYGLDTENELKMLRAYQELRTKIPSDLVTTFMGADAIPPEFEGRTEDYVDLVINEMIPAVAENNLAEFCDIFTEKGVFTCSTHCGELESLQYLGDLDI